MANRKLAVAKKEYTKQDGSKGTEWCSIGMIGVSQNGKEYILLDPSINLAGLPKGENGMVMVGVFEENNQGQQNNNNQQGGNQGYQQQNQGQQQGRYGGQQQGNYNQQEYNGQF